MKYSNGRVPEVGDKVISAASLDQLLTVIDVATGKLGTLGYWESVGTVCEVRDGGVVRVHRDEVAFGDPVGFTYDVYARAVIVGGDS